MNNPRDFQEEDDPPVMTGPAPEMEVENPFLGSRLDGGDSYQG